MLRNGFAVIKYICGIGLTTISFVYMYQLVYEFQELSNNENAFSHKMRAVESQIKGLASKTKRNTKIKIVQLEKKQTFPVFSSWISLNTSDASNKAPKSDKMFSLTYPKCKQDYYLIFIVQVDQGGISERMAIRKTWGKLQNTKSPKWKVFFLVSCSPDAQNKNLINYEMQTYGDLIHADVDQTKEINVATISSILGFRWAVDHCNYQYLFKLNIEYNIFINIHQLLIFLNDKWTPDSELYAGYVYYNNLVKRIGDDKIAAEEYSKPWYVRHCSGIAYILSSDVVVKMMTNAKNVKLFKFEEIYTGELALLSGVDAYHNKNFQINQNTCEFIKEAIVHYPLMKTSCLDELMTNV